MNDSTALSDRLLQALSAVPFITDGHEPVHAELKREPEDFVVEEIPAYLPSGQGEHLYLWIEKTGLNTPDAAGNIVRALDCRFDQASWAGLKDKRAVTRQWISIHTPQTPTAEALSLEGVRVLEVTRHVNKLRTGHLRGNRFQLRLRGVAPENDGAVQAILAALSERGLPNYYGAQRFGHAGRNIEGATRWIVEQGKAPPKPFLRKLFVSTLQSALFNLWLAERIRDGLFDHAVAGDILRKEDTGGLFVCEDPEIDGARVRSWEISPTGPMFGGRMKSASGPAHERESALLSRWAITLEQLARVEKFGEGTRRVARVRPEEITCARSGDDLLLGFALPKGSYATAVVEEITKTRGLTLEEDA